MKKKLALLITTGATTTLAIAALAFSPKLLNNKKVKGDQSYTMVLDANSKVVTKDGGILNQITIKNNKFDMIGYTPAEGELGVFKQTTYSGVTYHGLIYNRSIINGLTSVKVEYYGESPRILFTKFLMEDMDFVSTTLVNSGISYYAPAGCGYFTIIRNGSNPVTITKIEVTYACQGNLDNQMIFNKNSTMGGARSLAKTTNLEDSFVELENNPTRYTNNYSQGKHEGHTNNDSWYRFNGRYFANSGQLGTEFTFGMTVIGEYSAMVDQSKNFHYNVWPQFDYGNANDRPWLQTYIGNDNYEPLGAANALHPDDPYAQFSYPGRFFGDYVYSAENGWHFQDPDTNNIPGRNKTYREAFEEYNLPFWFLKFHVYLTTIEEEEDGNPVYRNNVPVCDIYINNMLIYAEQEMFDDYDTVNTPSISIYTMPMHLINYGVDADGTPDNSYTGCFTYPRLIED